MRSTSGSGRVPPGRASWVFMAVQPRSTSLAAAVTTSSSDCVRISAPLA